MEEASPTRVVVVAACHARLSESQSCQFACLSSASNSPTSGDALGWELRFKHELRVGWHGTARWLADY